MGFSQAPVMDDGRPNGLLTECKILEMTKPYHKLLVEDAMEEPVLIPKEANYQNLIPLLRQFQAVLVVDRGKMVGIITSTDLIGHKKKR
jgi:predicted transcriptional regulator